MTIGHDVMSVKETMVILVLPAKEVNDVGWCNVVGGLVWTAANATVTTSVSLTPGVASSGGAMELAGRPASSAFISTVSITGSPTVWVSMFHC